MELEKLTKDLSEETKRRPAEAKTEEELSALLPDGGQALPDEALDQVTGGVSFRWDAWKRVYEVYDKDGNWVASYTSWSETMNAVLCLREQEVNEMSTRQIDIVVNNTSGTTSAASTYTPGGTA